MGVDGTECILMASCCKPKPGLCVILCEAARWWEPAKRSEGWVGVADMSISFCEVAGDQAYAWRLSAEAGIGC